jgi:uncharacterized protein (TIGR02996 family)
MDESAFLGAIEDGDDAALAVYADWLLDQGDEARSAFLRAQEVTRRLTHRRRCFLAAAREVIALGTGLPLGWLLRVSRPRLVNTVWAGTDSHGDYYIWRFLSGGEARYSSPTGDWGQSSWRQIGPLALIETSWHYAAYEGLVAGRTLRGWAANIASDNWRWTLRLRTERSAQAEAPYCRRWGSSRRSLSGPAVRTLPRRLPARPFLWNEA